MGRNYRCEARKAEGSCVENEGLTLIEKQVQSGTLESCSSFRGLQSLVTTNC
jgi:hypothetical protein